MFSISPTPNSELRTPNSSRRAPTSLAIVCFPIAGCDRLLVARNRVSAISSNLYSRWKKETRFLYPGVGAIAPG